MADHDGPAGHRDRLLAAMEESIAVKGFHQTTVGDVVARARTSRRTFYAHFAGREQCLIALHTEVNAGRIAHITAAVDFSAPWRMQVKQAVEAWISFADAHPAIMLSWVRDVPALDSLSRELQRDIREELVVLIQKLTSTEEFVANAGGPVSRLRAIVLLGGLDRLTAVTVESGKPMETVRDEAVDASIALLGPAVRR